MDRAVILNQLIIGIKNIREEGSKIFSSEFIIPNAELMIEEYFEAKFNPYLDKIPKQIRALPEDEYIIVLLDTWIKNLQDELNHVIENVIIDEYAEVLYIKQKYLPIMIERLLDIKLEMLEREFRVQSQESPNITKAFAFSNEIALKPDGMAVLASLLYNHRIVKSSNSIDDLCIYLANLSGYQDYDIKKHLKFDSVNARLKADASLDELERILKIIKVMGVRIETSIAENKRK